MTKKFADIILTDYFNKSVGERKGWHRSDAIACPLKAYWRLTGEIKQELGPENVGILLLGELAHVVLHRNFDAQEKVHLYKGVQITVDGIDGKYPIETKTTRKSIYKKEDLLEEWLEQLAIAMSVMNVNKGYLMVLNLISFGLNIWEITMTDKEREMFLKAFEMQILSIGDAIKRRTPSLLKPKYKDCFWCGYKPKTGKKGCPFYKKDGY